MGFKQILEIQGNNVQTAENLFSIQFAGGVLGALNSEKPKDAVIVRRRYLHTLSCSPCIYGAKFAICPK